jgi:hypothetical protein
MLQGGYLDISEELTMTKSILISLAVLAVSTSGALAAYRTHYHYHHHAAYHPAMNANASVAAAPVLWRGGVSSADYNLYIRSLHESGYDPKNNYDANGTLKTQ